MATRRTSTKATAENKAPAVKKQATKKPTTRKKDGIEIDQIIMDDIPEKASLPNEWDKQAKEILKLAESSGLQENFFFKTTFERYLTQVKILADLQKTIESSETLVKKEYVKGRGNLYTNPAIREYNSTTDSANKTVQTLIKILKGFKVSDSGNDHDALMDIINGGNEDE